ncbi:hypothetical protein C1878_02990 [Gordonibacter sp. 28C]|uniref:vWA domain-containing protein n=1 Tax=Gordonibacter sp. 28C TaxID=2078569 RepID=UPI000DF7A9FF|nr:VWA-like domain-containing protein [Gordonibacter sp. 28C]RDB63780.1 hypothetical protein C1878_02990 [Gordonibacter sp. 28C]
MAPVPETMDDKLKRREGEDRLGADIVDECRVQLMLKFRFLDLALWRMDLAPLRVEARYPLATDAGQVFYDPPRVIARFRESFEESVRDYLHLVLHCVFRHPFDEGHDSREAWGLACDIVVENAAMDLCGGRFACADDSARRQALSEIGMLVGHVLPGKVYGLVKGLMQTPDGQQYRGLGQGALNEWRVLFERDDHGAWPANNKTSKQGEDADEPEEVSEDDGNPEAEADALRTEEPGTDDAEAGGAEAAAETEARGEDEPADDDAADTDEADTDSRERSREAEREAEREEREWEDVSKQIEMNLETFSKEWGEEAGSLVANLAFANRATCSYTDFLRRFMVVGEEMRLNMDEFDYVYYTYGMELYGNMPLIEPLEYRETERVHDFVIAIDTSESVSGELVRKFLGHTFDILKSSESYASEVNIHLVQCDARVQSDTKIENLRDVDRVLGNMRIRGFGGTDFRPVFDYVDRLRKTGELANLKGLVYFTDGLGQFPEKTPDYDAAFVFVDEGDGATPPVPPWACKVLIDESGIDRLKSKAER